jgi:ATP-dependent DNA helicase RecG
MKGNEINWSRLVQRESVRVEWKENVADERGVVKTLCAFANDIQQVGGGRVICGLKEEKNEFGEPVAKPVGLDEKRFKEIKNKVLSICHRQVEPPLTPTVEDYPVEGNPGRKLLVFSVTASQYAHRYRTKKEGTHYYVRVNDRTQPADGLISKLLEQKKEWPPYLEQTHPDAVIDDIDWFALKEFLGRLKLPLSLANYMEPDVKFRGDVQSLVTFPPGGAPRQVPRNFSLLLFGKEPHRFFRGAYAIFSVYQGKDKTASRSQRFEIFGPIPELIRNIMSKLQLYMGIEIDKTGDIFNHRQNRLRFSAHAVQEGIVNAFVHRDYHSHEPVRITVYDNRIEIASPGELYNGLRIEQLRKGKAQPSWRNPSLAWFMVGLDFAQNEGRGISIIINETQKIAGETPGFELIGNWLVLVIPAYVPPGNGEEEQIQRQVTAVDIKDEEKETVVTPGPYLDYSIPFVGRKKELAQIRESIDIGSSGIYMITGRLFSIDGAGGVGKTALAIEAAKQWGKNFKDGVIPPIRMDEHTPMSFAVYLAHQFNLRVDEPTDGGAAQRLVTSILKDRHALLILDNAVDWKNLKYMLPLETRSTILVTTRNRELYDRVRIQFPGFQMHEIALEKFTEVEALDLFRKMLGKKYNKDEERIYLEIAGNLGFLPLALRQAISLIIFGPGYTAARLLEKLENEDRLELLRKGKAAAESDELTVESVFDLSSPLLTPGLIEALEYLAACSPGPVPLEFLQQLSKDEEIQERLDALYTISWCDRREIDGRQNYELHPLVRELVQRRYGKRFQEYSAGGLEK